MSPVYTQIPPCSIENSCGVSAGTGGPERCVKFTPMSDERVIRSEPQNRPSFHFDRATPPATLSFASQKHLLAFYSSMQNAPFGVNRAQNAFFENVCRNSMFFAHVPEMTPPGLAIRGRSGAGLGGVNAGVMGCWD